LRVTGRRASAAQDIGERGAVLLRVRRLARQGDHLLGLALFGRAGFQCVEEFGHGGMGFV
jgi:hypothetical protein